MPKRKTFVVLLHYPIVNKHGEEVVTSVTNLDIHDIARSCKTYGVSRYFIVNPEPEQERLVGQIIGHWREEISKIWHPARARALALCQFCRSFEEAYNEADRLNREDHPGAKAPFVVMPDARELKGVDPWSYAELREKLASGRLGPDDDGFRPLMVVYGTGWGISESFFPKVDRVLRPLRALPNPINDESRYNHLSVRAAAAIVLDRLFGQ